VLGKIAKVILVTLIILILVGLAGAQMQLSGWFGGRIANLEERNALAMSQIEALGQREKSLELARAELIGRLKGQAAAQAVKKEVADSATATPDSTISLNKDLAALDSQMQALNAQQLAADKQLSARLAAQATSTNTVQATRVVATNTVQVTQAS
jgi:hypothetical protein